MSYYYGGYPYGYGYPYGGYPYGYPYGCGYPYSLPLLANEYKLSGLYNELDELNDVEAQYGRDFKPDVSMNHGLHTQLKQKNYELVQHIVQKDAEISELRALLKKQNIHHDISMSPVDNPTKPKFFYPPYHHHYRYPYYPYPCPYPYYRDGMSDPHAKHMIVPRALDPAHYHLRTLPCVLPPVPVPEPVPVPVPVPP